MSQLEGSNQCSKGLGALTNFIRTFSGEKGADPSIMEFVESIDRVSVLGGWDFDNVMMVVYSKLKGVGLEFFRLSPQIQMATTWLEVRTGLLNRFGDRNGPRDPIRDIQGIKQSRDERVVEFALRLQSVVSRINSNKNTLGITIDDVYVRRLFVDGVQETIRTHILSDKDLTLSQLIDKAEWIQGELERMGGRRLGHVMSMDFGGDGGATRIDKCRENESMNSLMQDIRDRLSRLEMNFSRSEQSMTSPQDEKCMVNAAIAKVSDRCVETTGKDAANSPPKLVSSVKDARRNALVAVSIRGGRYNALIDPGAYVSIINEGFVKELELGRWVKEVTPFRIMGFGNAEVEARYQIDVWIFFELGKKKFTHPFILADNVTCLGYPIILGYDFFKHKGIDLILSKGVLEVDGTPIATIIESDRK